ncbi:MAG TPA: hypothetical protein VKH42_11080, partial [Vicinamibacterales bacterium]|nr:hypothetical protein [Vicinamibacterales bacterium]
MPIGRALIVCGLLAWCAVIGLAAGLPAFALHASAGEQAPAAATGFVGSKACERCHADISARWAKTRMANVVRDPKQHPEAFIPDFSIPDPLSRSQRKTSRSFTAASGSSATLRKVGDDYFPLGAQWDVTHKLWRRYFVADNTDWWVPHYP